MPTGFTIRPVRTGDDLAATARLFDAYAAALGIDLSYQDFATERATLPGKYAAPGGEVLLARDINGQPLGCVALRPLAFDGSCEMKRLYVEPEGRGLGLGKALVERIVEEAERIGYRDMKLDTLPFMGAAMALYAKAGFRRVDPYYETPVAGTIFMARTLRPG